MLAIVMAVAWGYTYWKNSGLDQNGKVGTESAKEKAPSAEQATTQEKPERERVIVENTDYDSIDNTLYGWWFKRNDNHEASGCQEDFDITEYQAYYKVPVNEKKMYITFDCGYENGYTADILDILKEERGIWYAIIPLHIRLCLQSR